MPTNDDNIHYTGYFGRASEHGLPGRVGRVNHIVDAKTHKPICRYSPHPTMSFQWVAGFVHINEHTCKGCKDSLDREYERLAKEKFAEAQAFCRKHNVKCFS